VKAPKRPDKPAAPRSNAAFLLAQIGSHAAARFAERLLAVGLAPPHAGILRILGATPGITQQALAARLQMVPSRLVALLDTLDSRGLVERRRNQEDRRSHALHLTAQGRKMLATLGEIARDHQRDLLAALSEEERRHLQDLLQRVVDQQGLTPHVHPGYSSLGSATTSHNGPR
jgi:DNA-binding MarR family transcriptional regulator